MASGAAPAPLAIEPLGSGCLSVPLAWGNPLAHPIPADLPRGDVETIPGVDRGDREHERGELRVVVVARGVVPHVVRNGVRAIGETGSRLGERQSGPLGLGEVRDISPDGDRVDALIGFARMLELAGVHVDADAATVDLA